MPSLDRYKARMVEVEKEASLVNPAELRKQVAAKDARIAALERELKATSAGVSALSKVAVQKPPKVERVEVPVLSAKDRKLIARASDHAEASSSKAAEFAKALATLRAHLEQQLVTLREGVERLSARDQAILAQPPAGRHNMQPTPSAFVSKKPAASRAVEAPPEGVTPARQKILNGLAFVEQVLGLRHADRDQLAFLSVQSPSSGGYANNLGALRSLGLLDYPAKGRVGLTDAGRALAVIEDVPATSSELHAIVQRRLPPARWRIIASLIKAYPRDVDRAELAELSNQSPSSGGYANNLGALRSLGLLDYPSKGSVIATPALFLEGR
jgi:hypothetical protein